MKDSKVRLICFTGIDGSGKTTLARDLVETMRQKGIQYNYVYGRFKPFVLKPFISIGRKIFLRDKDMFVDYKEYSNTKRDAIKQNSFLFSCYRYTLLLDYFLQLLFKVRLPLMFGKNLVCDRYVYDTVITDLSVDMHYSNSDIKDLIKKYFFIASKPSIAFLIDVPEEIAFQRKVDTPSIEYLKERRGTYLDVGKEFGMMILDGSKNLNESKNIIQKRVIEEMMVK